MKKGFSIMMILLIGLLAACGTSDKANNSTNGSKEEEKKVIVMGTSADYPPFEYIDTAKGEEIIGFDVDIAKSLADKLGYEVQIKDMEFSGLISALENGQVDFVLSGMTPTEERKKSVDFSDVYYTAHHMIVSSKDSGIKSIDDLKGKTVGVQLGSIQEEKATEMAKTIDFKIENRNRIPELIQEIKAGRFDAAIIEDTVANGYFKKNKDIEGFTIEDAAAEEAGSAIAFPKNSDLTEDFNTALNEMIENGELDKLVVKWFGGE
ncbi:transporter substrate-binding domain-containing protein [Bacillus sp. CGMCC 1.16607]|uniref:transporter substrate-binding domain-containing protein n=1 Tax=Bacillus sp. CGMCC 1.16607 TaxID=3351842 RepID=UPI003631F0D0